MFTEMVEYGRKIEGKVKAMESEIKENVQGTNRDRKETRTQIYGSDQKEEINSRLEQNEETRIQKYEERLRNLQENFKHSKTQIIGVTEGEEQQQDIENLFENIMKENFPNLAKEIDFQEVQKTRESQRSWTQRGTHQGTSSSSYPRLKMRES